MFRAIISPILRSTRRCCLQAASSVHYTTSCKHSLVLLRMGEIIARNMLIWLKLLIKLLLLHLVGCFYYCINDAWSHKHQNWCINSPRNTVEDLCNFGDSRYSRSHNITSGRKLILPYFLRFSYELTETRCRRFSQKEIKIVGFVPMLRLLPYFATTCRRKRVPALLNDFDCLTWAKSAVKNLIHVMLFRIYTCNAIRNT